MSFARTPPPNRPWCVLAKVQFGMLRTIKVPEDNVPWLTKDYDWEVLIRDTDLPAEAHIHWAPQMNRDPSDDGA